MCILLYYDPKYVVVAVRVGANSSQMIASPCVATGKGKGKVRGEKSKTRLGDGGRSRAIEASR